MLHNKFFLQVIAVVMLLSFTACGSGSEPVIQTVDTPAAEPEYLSFFATKTVIGNDLGKYWTDSFTDTYNKQVYISFDGSSYYADEGLSYRELLEKRLKSSDPDDLYIINAEDVLEFGQKGYWMDLSQMDFVKNLSETALYQSTYNGKVFSLPLAITGFGFVWNTDILESCGLSVPENLQEFWDVCQVLKANGILPYGANKGYSLTVPAMCTGLAQLYNSPNQSGLIDDLNSGKTPISAYMRDGFSFLAQMIEKGYLDPRQALESNPQIEDVALFLDGKCAFICLAVSNIPTEDTCNFSIDATGLPVLAQGSISVYGGIHRLCVNPNSKHLDTALQFIEMVGTPQALERSAQLDHSISSASSSASPSSDEFPLASLLRQPGQVPNQDFALHFNTWENIRDVSRELCAGATVDEACAMLDQRQREELEKYGKNAK